MLKIVLIQANPSPGFNFHGEAHRLWPAATPVRVTVLDGEEDPEMVPVKRKSPDGDVVDLAPNPNVIGKRSFRALQANPRIRILSDVDTIQGALESAAKDEAAKLRAENSFLRSEVANMEVENDQLKAKVLELERAAGIAPTPFPRPVEEQDVVAVEGGDGVESDEAAEAGAEDPARPARGRGGRGAKAASR